MTAISSTYYAMTIDVEDYFHVAAFKDVIDPNSWDEWPCRVERNTRLLLDLFSERGVTCTFFVLGWVAERFPSLVKEIVSRGHELASHGMSHQLVYEQSPDIFRSESERSKKLLEDIAGIEVLGYRAASYSITRSSIWALDILVELGFTWDSSIFPVHHDTYGMPQSPTFPYLLRTPAGGNLREFPLTTFKLSRFNIPAAGGGYFRQYPYALSKWLLDKASDNGKKPAIFYLHPWEIDPEQPRIPSARLKSKIRHYTNLDRCKPRLEQLLEDFKFTSVENVMNSFFHDNPVSDAVSL